MAERWREAEGDKGLWTDAVKATTKQLVEANQSQLLLGIGSDGSPLPAYKWEGYAEEKSRMNPKNGGRYDMRYTGHSFGTMKANVEGDKVTFASEGTMAEWDNKLGGDIFGVFEGSALMDYRAYHLYPLVVKRIKEIIAR